MKIDIEKALWTCDANFGRSQIAETLFKKYYPNVPNGSAALLFSKNILAGRIGVGPHSEVKRVMGDLGFDMRGQYAKGLEASMVTDLTDVFLLGNPEYALLFHIPKLSKARSVVAMPLDDPSEKKNWKIYY